MTVVSLSLSPFWSDGGAAMEEIEELRAKAIASMPSAGNPNPTPISSKSPASKEEGELTPGEEELPTCSTQPDITVEDEPISAILANNTAQNTIQASTLPAGSASRANVDYQKSITESYSKQSRARKMPPKTSSSKVLSWHGKGSNDNLVISFSDDDSGSDSDESRLEQIVDRKVDVVKANKSKVPMTSAQIQREALQRVADRTKSILKKGFVNRASDSSVTKAHGANFRSPLFSLEKDSFIPKHTSAVKSSTSLEHGHRRDVNQADHRVESLRHEIALRENELKGHNKSMAQSRDAYPSNHGPNVIKLEAKVAGISRLASASAVGLASNERSTKRLKLDGTDSKLSSDGQLQLLKPSTKSAEFNGQVIENNQCPDDPDDMNTVGWREGCKEKSISIADAGTDKQHQDAGTNIPGPLKALQNEVKDTRRLVPIRESTLYKNGNGIVHVSAVSSKTRSQKSMPLASTTLHETPYIPQSAPRIGDRSYCENYMTVLRDPSTEHAKNSSLGMASDASDLLTKEAACEYNVVPGQQIVGTTSGRVPVEISHCIPEKHPVVVSESALGNREINIVGDASVNLQSLVELEELQDKQLEAAQELRRRCELEERHALKAYRKAQRALVEANEQCSHLYRKRELFSAQLALIVEASNSILPSSWQQNRGPASNSLETVPKTGFDLLSNFRHLMPGEGQILDQLGYESNSQCLAGAPADASFQKRNVNGFVSDHSLEHDASTPDYRQNSALEGGCTPANHANVYTDDDNDDDDENFSSDSRLVETRLGCNSKETNHEHRTAGVNSEMKRLSSIESVQDYEQLEASLRSKLVARLGMRTSTKTCSTSNAGGTDDRADHIGVNKKSSALFYQKMQEREKNQSTYSEGAERPEKSTSQATACQSDGINLIDGAQKIGNPDENNSIPRESFWPTHRTVFTSPSSALHVVSGHAKFILPDCHGGSITTTEKYIIERNSSDDSAAHVPDEESTMWSNTRYARTREIYVHDRDLAINPFWPFCMFELRGKCNDEECRLQHAKHCAWRNLKHDELSDTYGPEGHVGHSLTVGKSKDGFASNHGPLFHITIPTYLIGSTLIKVDTPLLQPVLAGNNSQYWQRGFCASFPLPFSVQRILPSDAPLLRTSDGSVADDYSWNRLSLYYQSEDDPKKKMMQGLHDSEQSLEMALELIDGKDYEAHKKALSLLSRALEADPSSVVLWVIYLHLYYRKEKGIGKDDMFFHAVQNNEGSYELWLMYINSRMQLGDRLNAYDSALTVFCRRADTLNKERKYISACILDIFLQMIDFLCMSGDVEKAIWRINGLLPATAHENFGDTLMSDIYSCLTLYDRSIFWFCCIYLSIYRKLPQSVVQQFEFEKDMPFGTEWPSTLLTKNRKDHAFKLLKFAVNKMGLDTSNNPYKEDPTVLRSLNFLAVSHVQCVGALEGLHCSADLLAKYLKLYPTCVELVLMSVRLHEDCTEDALFRWFKETISNWPKEIPGVQCLWNQYTEHALMGKKFDFAEKLMFHWSQDFMRVKCSHDRVEGGEHESCAFLDLSSHVYHDEGINTMMKNDIFLLLNLFLYRLLQKNTEEARLVIDKALKLAVPEDYKHCVREHAAFTLSGRSDSLKDVPLGVISGLLNGYLGDSRSNHILEPLSRRCYRNIKKPRLRNMINDTLGPVSRDCTLMNSVLEVCYGPSLLPERIDEPKVLVDFVESLMEIAPGNYKLALSVYLFTTGNFSHASVASCAIKFWASCILVNSICQAIPVAPEHIWLEAANVMTNSGNLDISSRFIRQAVSVYPFSINLWRSYLNLSKNSGNVDVVIESARKRGFELNQIAD